jgi:hypothetical protein
MGGVFSDNTYNFVAMSRLLPYFFMVKAKKQGWMLFPIKLVWPTQT